MVQQNHVLTYQRSLITAKAKSELFPPCCAETIVTDPFEYPLAPHPPESAPEAAFPPPAPEPPPPTNKPFSPID